MKTPLALLLLGCVLARTDAAWAADPERVWISGREYVRLSEWAKQHSFQFTWTGKEECQVATRWSKAVFTANSCRMSLNGVSVWLSAPIAVHSGAAHIAAVDLATALRPALFPTKNRPGARVRTICLDAGHGGKDTGNREGARHEKDYTLALAKELSAELAKSGYKVVLTRNTDAFVELEERTALARRRSADLFVSLHFNGTESGSDAKGAEVYCLTPARTSSTNARGEGADSGSYWGNQNNAQNLLLAYEVQKAIVQKLGLEDRGVRRARFQVLRSATMPAILIEGGFMSNPSDARKISDPAWRRRLAQTVAGGIEAYRRGVEASSIARAKQRS